MTNVALALSHSIEEHDQLRLLTSVGIPAFSIGGYINPSAPHDPKRPPLPDVPYFPDLKAAVDAMGSADNLGAAQANLPPAILDWADVLIYHHQLDRLFGQWGRIRQWLRAKSHRRVIWRTVGQSVEHNERQAAFFRGDGLEIVRYSPREVSIPGFAGQDALIRFYKDPDEWQGWTGTEPTVLNIAQHDREPGGRDKWLNWDWVREVTAGLPFIFGGPNTELIGGRGTLSLDAMQGLLRTSRCYLYSGTQPASYTLGLIEAMMTGIPVVSITPDRMTIFPYGPEMFEGRDIAFRGDPDVKRTRGIIERLLLEPDRKPPERARAIELFGMETIGRQWAAFLR